MLLLLFSGTKAGTTPAPATKKVGWPNSGRRWHDPKDLERRLALQRGNTFGRRWFDEFVAAQEAATERIEKTDNLEQKTILQQAVGILYGAVDRAITLEIAPPVYMIEALQFAATIDTIAASIKYAERVIEEDQEETAAAVLLLH